jgi:hypothetical protein
MLKFIIGDGLLFLMFCGAIGLIIYSLFGGKKKRKEVKKNG